MVMDDEIVQDFLIEGGETLEQLDAQLVSLESSPDDKQLLNAVFRAFHTIKGGAGFLGLEHLVAVSHKSEDIFDMLRKGALRVDASLMDSFLQVLDVLRVMFDELRGGEAPSPAPAELLARLKAIADGTATPAPSAEVPVAAASVVAAAAPEVDPMAAIIDEMSADDDPDIIAAHDHAASDLITEEEFDALLDKLEAKSAQAAPSAAASDPDLITEEEFDALLVNLKAQKSAEVASAVQAQAGNPDLITDAEFEALLDDMHGAGRFVATALPNVAAAPIIAAPPAADKVAKPAARAAAEAPKDTTVRVETEVLDRIMNMVGELVLIRNRLLNLESSIGNEAVTHTVANLDVVTSDLQMAAMKTRMQPIKKVFGRFPRVVRDLARSLNKQIELVMEGEDTDLDKNLVEALADPLVHLVRNSVDHGIEMPADRIAAGKPATGILRLAAAQGGDQIVLTIADDGKGIDAEALRRKVVEKGLMDEDAAGRLSTRECYELIFLPGFSTKDEISDISGRGVGMDVVKTRITQVNGSIEIDSQLGVGTTIRISVPLTLAIMPTLMVVLGTQVFALPLVNVQEIINFERHQAREVDGRKTMVVRGKALPLFYLSRWLIDGVYEFNEQQGHVVVVRIGNHSVGLLVDDLIGQEEVVIKPLGALLHGIKGLSGATITGNGKIALILDLPGLLESYARR
ncbi:MAG: chemotaxis protein CheA [Gammaproteobacteria bacterium]|nr:chemotaxis protein CheA [Gammaproteobacteria bacterium]